MEMAIHSSILAWVSPWTVEPGGLYSPCGYTESLVIYLFIFLNEHYLMYFSLLLIREGAMCVCSVVSDSLTLWTVAHQAVCPWHSPGKNTGGGCHFLLHGIFLTQELNPHLLYLLLPEVNSLPLCHLGSLEKEKKIVIAPPAGH